MKSISPFRMRAFGLLHARLRRSARPVSPTTSKPHLFLSPNGSITDSFCKCSPLSTIINDKYGREMLFANHRTAFHLHNSHQHHRGRGPCALLLVPKSKAPRPQRTHISACLREALPTLASDNTPVTCNEPPAELDPRGPQWPSSSMPGSRNAAQWINN